MSDSNVVGRGTGTAQPERVKAPLVGIVGGLLMVGGLVAWTGTRVATATKAQAELAEKRAVEAERNVALAKQPERVRIVQGTPATWLPSVELDGTLAAQQSASVGFKVGYEKPSYFSRDYKKQFGAPPQRDEARINLEALRQDARAVEE